MKRPVCPICADGAVRSLPDPALISMRSDGWIAQEPLRKASCLACGAAFRRQRRAFRVARSDAYTLNAKSDNEFDVQRQNAYAHLVALAVHRPPAQVVDLGCGNGALLQALGKTWPTARCTGVEPALLPRSAAIERQLDVRATARGLRGADLAVSVNVIEHTPDPRVFLAEIASILRPGGHCVLVWPADNPTNMELLFNDHLFTLPDAVVRQLAHACGLRPLSTLAAPDGFQAMLLRKGGSAGAVKFGRRGSALRALRLRTAYMRRWATLDTALHERLRDDLAPVGFGVGEAAQALRAYAPRTWARVEGLTADTLAGQRALGLPLLALNGLHPDRHQVLLATHPRSQVGLAKRLGAAGFHCVRWDDIIDA